MEVSVFLVQVLENWVAYIVKGATKLHKTFALPVTPCVNSDRSENLFACIFYNSKVLKIKTEIYRLFYISSKFTVGGIFVPLMNWGLLLVCP